MRRALLQSTVFLVVSSPEDGESESLRRAEMVERMLRDRQVDSAKIRRWLYAYPATKGTSIAPPTSRSRRDPRSVSRRLGLPRRLLALCGTAERPRAAYFGTDRARSAVRRAASTKGR